MNNDDDPIRGDRDSRHSRPYGSNRRAGGGFGGRSGGLGGLFDGLGDRSGSGLFDRIARDVSSWFDDDDERGVRRPDDDGSERFGHRTSGGRSRHGARSGARTENVGSARREAVHLDDDYADEGGSSGSLRGRGPKNYRRTDERITELVNDALHDDDAIDASDIEVSVKDGDVTLSGSVPFRRHKHRAENVAVRVSGVHDVDNRLRVKRDAASASAGSAGGTPGESRRDADDYGHPS